MLWGMPSAKTCVHRAEIEPTAATFWNVAAVRSRPWVCVAKFVQSEIWSFIRLVTDHSDSWLLLVARRKNCGFFNVNSPRILLLFFYCKIRAAFHMRKCEWIRLMEWLLFAVWQQPDAELITHFTIWILSEELRAKSTNLTVTISYFVRCCVTVIDWRVFTAAFQKHFDVLHVMRFVWTWTIFTDRALQLSTQHWTLGCIAFALAKSIDPS